jgi:curli production assembly/transport component CsgF
MKRSVRSVACSIACILFLISSGTVLASQLIWTPINPSFGGSYFNGAWLLSSAQAQNKLTMPREPYERLERDPIEDFKETLNRQILYQLSRRIIEGAFGEEGIEEGHYELEEYTIDITRDIAGIKIVLVDVETGNETIIEVPYY